MKMEKNLKNPRSLTIMLSFPPHQHDRYASKELIYNNSRKMHLIKSNKIDNVICHPFNWNRWILNNHRQRKNYQVLKLLQLNKAKSHHIDKKSPDNSKVRPLRKKPLEIKALKRSQINSYQSGKENLKKINSYFRVSENSLHSNAI